MSYDRVYKQGFNINTPIDFNLQKIATASLRDGLLSYDKGMEGPIVNVKKLSKKLVFRFKKI